MNPLSLSRFARHAAGILVTTFAFTINAPAAPGDAGAQATARAILDATGVKGGFVVHLGALDWNLTAALRANSSYQVHALFKDPTTVAAARQGIRQLGAYGDVSADEFSGGSLPYIDNLVNLLVAEDLQGVSLEEVKRVLVPNGVAYVRRGGAWQKTVKSKNPGLDDWTHYFYDAKGNAVSKDTIVAPPERLQWVAGPRWSRHHDRMSSVSAQVTSGGRMFYIMDEGSRVSILLPAKWNLIARDAFNGTMLWKQPIDEWNTHLWPLKSGPTQLSRRLVADGDRLFVTLGIREPVTQLDGATGKILRTYEGTKGAEEMLHVNGTLFVIVNTNPWHLDQFAVKQQSDQKRVETEFNWDEKPRDLLAVEAASGKILWKKPAAKIAPLTLAADGRRVIFHDGDKIISLDAAKGSEQWASTKATKRQLFEFNYGPRVLLTGDTVLYAGGDGSMKGLDAISGKELWTAPHEKSGYRSPEDLIVAGGLVWNAGTLSGGQTGEFKGRDPRTGEIKRQFAPDVPPGTYWFHHRCYIAKATEQFLIPSRTGIEYVDHEKKHWDLNHWVRGACLYGVLPANGLTYAGPHNCACYPEAKLDGMNALAPGSNSPHPAPVSDEQRLVKGPAYGATIAGVADPFDWPTYRHDNARSGYSAQPLADDLKKSWELRLGGPLSAVTIADGKLFVSQVDRHTLHALDAATGAPAWTFTAGGRVDSPPTYWKGRVLFGCKDGRVYCLRASDGALVWRFQAAPNERRHFAFDQLESVWPVHGSVLVENDVVSFVSGRSVFLDGGLRFFRLDAATGKKHVEQVYNEIDPETGRDFQERHKTLQMPVGLNDILSSDGKWTFLRSQKIAADGRRVDIGPISANAPEQGAAQQGDGKHIFAPMGYLDDSWFHRSYWVYGKNFAGGHNGYFQAGKNTPTGRILVFDDKNVYAYGRESQYHRWTTTLEHQLFSTPRDIAETVKPPPVDPNATASAKGKKGKATAAAATTPGASGTVDFQNPAKLDAAGKPFTIELWTMLDGADGALVSHGAGLNGYALTVTGGKLSFHIRSAQSLASATSKVALSEGWHHIATVLGADKKVKLYVDGALAAEADSQLIAVAPKQGLRLGGDTSAVTGGALAGSFSGMLDQFAIYHRELGAQEISTRAAMATPAKPAAGAVLFSSFDNGDARDESGNGLHGVSAGVDSGKGKVGGALWFRKGPAAAPAPAVASNPNPGAQPAKKAAGGGIFFKPEWGRYVPVVTRAMAMSGKTILLSGPPDVLDEEYAFERLSQKDTSIFQQLKDQDDALEGKKGGRLWAVSMTDGSQKSEVDLQSPPVWDGMAVAQGRLFIASMDGVVRCFGVPKK